MAKKHKINKNSKKHFVKKMQDTEGLNYNFGQYQEANGGGHPFELGNSNTRTTRENGKIREQENPNTKQPRDAEGRFTYKSVNGESIDPKYGPSRGVTVPPTLTGGNKGGVTYIKDVENDFASQSGAYWDKYKDKWYTKSGKVVTAGLSTKISGKAVWEQAKEYNKELGEYDEIIGNEFAGTGEKANWKTKSGRKSSAEKSAIQKAKKDKEQQNVISSKTGGIETVGSNKPKFKAPAPTQTQPQPQAPVSQPQGNIQPTGQGIGKSKYSDEQFDEAKQILSDNGIDVEGLSVSEIDELIDTYIEF